jgi:hypothetical protein
LSRIPASGHPAHTRMLEVELLAEPDGRLRARGSILDLRRMGFAPMVNDVQTSGFVHHMQIELAIAADSPRVEAIRIEQPYVAVEASAATGGESCRDPRDRLLALEGELLEPGFEKRVSQLFGGPLGCSHLLTLGQTMGRTLPHVIASERASLARSGSRREPGERIFKRAVFVDGLVSDDPQLMELVLQQADFTTRPRARVESPVERLDQQHEIQAHARVPLESLTLASLRCEERTRGLEELGRDAWHEWTDRSDELQDLVGARIIPGLGGKLLAKYAERSERRILQDALLHLGPGFLQCVAALSDGMMASSKPAPVHAAIGGQTDACYIWRSGGKIAQRVRK